MGFYIYITKCIKLIGGATHDEGLCEFNPALLKLLQEKEKFGCKPTMEHVEYGSYFGLLVYLGYFVWIMHSYVLEFEANEGRAMLAANVDAG
jgi:hypothetical protein